LERLALDRTVTLPGEPVDSPTGERGQDEGVLMPSNELEAVLKHRAHVYVREEVRVLGNPSCLVSHGHLEEAEILRADEPRIRSFFGSVGEQLYDA
jgi:hypothetical protein